MLNKYIEARDLRAEDLEKRAAPFGTAPEYRESDPVLDTDSGGTSPETAPDQPGNSDFHRELPQRKTLE